MILLLSLIPLTNQSTPLQEPFWADLEWQRTTNERTCPLYLIDNLLTFSTCPLLDKIPGSSKDTTSFLNSLPTKILLPSTQIITADVDSLQRGGHQLNILHVLFALFRRFYSNAPVRFMYLWAKPIESSPTTTIRKRARAYWVGSLNEESRRREWTIFNGFPSFWRREQGRISVANYFPASCRMVAKCPLSCRANP